MLLATLIPSRPRCARGGQRCPKADLGKPEPARGERQDLAPTSTPTPTAVSPGHFLPHLHGSPLAHKAPVHPLERKPPSPQKDSLMRGRQADLSPFCPLPGSPPAVTNLPSCTEQPCSVAWAAPDTLKGHGKSPPPSPIPTPASFHTLNTVPSTFTPLPTTIPGAASSSDCLLTIRDRWLRVQKRVGAGSRPHSSKGARRKALGVREDWLGCCSGGREGRGLGARASALPGFTVLRSTRPGTAGGVQGLGAEGTVLRDSSPPMGPAALCRLETPTVPARWATGLGREARSLLKPQQPQSKWTQLPGHQPDTFPPALVSTQGGRKGRTPGGGRSWNTQQMPEFRFKPRSLWLQSPMGKQGWGQDRTSVPGRLDIVTLHFMQSRSPTQGPILGP